MTADDLGALVATTLSETLLPVRSSVLLLDERVRAQLAGQAQVADRVRDLEALVSGLRERLAVVELRAPVPGPPGKDGKDGADGFGLDDFSVDFDGDRTILLAFARPGREPKRFPLTLPFQRYQGTYQAGRTYVTGDTVTSGGALWHCGATSTITRPGDSSDWQLAVKRGQDGRDLRDKVAHG
jgi:Carbohydrate binding domain.